MITSTSQSAPNNERSFSRRAQSIRHSGLEVSDHRRLGSGGLRSPTKSPKSGTRLDPIILGILVSSFTQWTFDSAQLLRAGSSQEVDRSPPAATVNSRAGVRQFGRPRGASHRGDPPRGLPLMRAEALAPCATGARS